MARATVSVNTTENVHYLHDRLYANPTLLSDFRALRGLAGRVYHALPLANP
jgi:hypothetical protein